MSRKASKLFVLSVLAAACAVPTSSLATQYRPGPGIAGAAIKKQYDCQWFHISQSCNLRAKGADRDEKCENNQWVDAGGDYINLADTSWEGDGIAVGATGQTTTWHLGTPTGEGGVEVKAIIRDRPTDPSGDANDVPDATITRQMYAYQAVAYMNSTSSGSGSPTKTVAEVGGAAQTNTLSLAHANIQVYGFGATASENGATAFGTATWRLDTLPVTATLGTGGQLKTTISGSGSGVFTGTVRDNDLVDGSITVAVGLSGGQGLSAGVEVEIQIGDEDNEGSVGAGFAFSSDDLGDEANDKWEFKSSELGDNIFTTNETTRTSSYGYSPANVTLRKGKGGESKAKAVIATKANAFCPGAAYPEANCEANIATSGSAVYTVGVPTYEQGTAPMPPAETGY
jgi:hypothetical protein